MWKVLFVLEILAFLSRRIGYLEKQIVKKGMVNSSIDKVTDWTTNN